jgi:hypothetical protein
MALVRCANVENGLRTNELLAGFVDETGTTDWQAVEVDYLVSEGGHKWLPVWLVHYDSKGRRALVELSEESLRGYRRFWIRASNMQIPELEQTYR